MTILTFPAAMPSPTKQKWTQVANSGQFKTYPVPQIETEGRPGLIWFCEATWTTLSPSMWRPLTAFLAQCRSASGRFYFGPRFAKSPQVTVPGGAILTSAGPAVGATSLSVYNAPALSNLGSAGDFVGIESSVQNELKILTAAAVANGGGGGVLNFEPPLWGASVGGAQVTYASPACLMGLAGDKEGGGQDNGRLTFRMPTTASVTIQMIERLMVNTAY